MATFGEVFPEILSNKTWWVSNGLNFLIFSFFVSVITLFIQQLSKFILERRYRGWKLRVEGYPDEDQDLILNDVRNIIKSPFEKWKFVKSVVSGVCQVKLRTVSEAEEVGWFRVDEKNKLMIVDFSGIPKEHISKWHVNQHEYLPKGWQIGKNGEVLHTNHVDNQ